MEAQDLIPHCCQHIAPLPPHSDDLQYLIYLHDSNKQALLSMMDQQYSGGAAGGRLNNNQATLTATLRCLEWKYLVCKILPTVITGTEMSLGSSCSAIQSFLEGLKCFQFKLLWGEDTKHLPKQRFVVSYLMYHCCSTEKVGFMQDYLP